MDATTKKSLWNSAGTAGLLLGLVSTTCMFGGQLANSAEYSPVLKSITGFFLWTVETVGCIYLMHFFMKKFSEECPGAGQREFFKMGMATAFLSALLYSAALFANMAFISADLYTEQYQLALQQTASMMDSNTLSMMEKMFANMPQISFFSNLVYCFIFGTVVSAVLSRNIISKDPFADYRPEEQ